ncbi:TIGR00645 family protein [Thiomicrorhabdus sp. 6S3-12]|uniref:TIGR00645 family protein n=1 Tax=Thiomicrorhabdus sp. 6S3-12 TaxID=2819681 RepID=UPI001AAC96C7|nr:TIGR00645 family protein [Thiomicrorhabdus sp. 6S3-12]MBO1924708.1 TIGR00645 family protein [Thiomicrorhabdus sp. 6S3-12]
MKRVETFFEGLLFASRWLMAPVYLGLVMAMIILLFKFGKELLDLALSLGSASSGNIIIGVLTLVDVALIMNLLIIIIFSGYENFVSKMDLENHEDRPEWMGHIGFSDLKIKVIASIVAISGIELLKAFMNVEEFSDKHLAWMIGLHVTFVVSGVMYALMDRLGHNNHSASKADNEH